MPSPQACGMSVIVVASSDQLSRLTVVFIAIQAVRGPIESTAEKAGMIVILALRIALGAVIVGLTRFDFIPACFPEVTAITNGHLVALCQLCLDTCLLTASLFKAYISTNRFYRRSGVGISLAKDGTGLILIVSSMGMWSVVSHSSYCIYFDRGMVIYWKGDIAGFHAIYTENWRCPCSSFAQYFNIGLNP
jgi:hypothetical protein